jgi:hypothetical protein
MLWSRSGQWFDCVLQRFDTTIDSHPQLTADRLCSFRRDEEPVGGTPGGEGEGGVRMVVMCGSSTPHPIPLSHCQTSANVLPARSLHHPSPIGSEVKELAVFPLPRQADRAIQPQAQGGEYHCLWSASKSKKRKLIPSRITSSNAAIEFRRSHTLNASPAQHDLSLSHHPHPLSPHHTFSSLPSLPFCLVSSTRCSTSLYNA